MKMFKLIALKRHALTAISYLIPIVVSAGFCLAIGSLFGGQVMNSFHDDFRLVDALSTMGVLVLGMLPVVISTGISYSIADKPGIAPGFLTGLIAINIGAGFIGGFIGGYIAGYIALLLREKIKVPHWAEGLRPVLIIPLLSAFAMGLIMYYVVGTPIAAFTELLMNYLKNLNTSEKIVYGLIIGVLSGIDYGGPINKTVVMFLLSLGPNGYEPMAVMILASMVTPFGMTIAYFMQKIFSKNIYTYNEVETLKAAFPMGVCQITEGCYPIIFNDLLRCLIATGVGGAVGGAISMACGSATPAPAGGLFAMVTMVNPIQWFIALMAGSLATAIILFVLKKRVNLDDNNELTIDDEKDIDLDSIKIS